MSDGWRDLVVSFIDPFAYIAPVSIAVMAVGGILPTLWAPHVLIRGRRHQYLLKQFFKRSQGPKLSPKKPQE